MQPGFIYNGGGPTYIVFQSDIADIPNVNIGANDVNNSDNLTFSKGREPGILVNITRAVRYKEQRITSTYTIESHICKLYRRVVDYNVVFANKRISLQSPSWQDDRVVRT